VKTYFECLPCVIRQSLEGISRVTDDETVHEEVLRRLLSELVRVDFQKPSPVIIGTAHRIIREVTAADDPYRTAKETCNRNALNLYPLMKKKIEGSVNALETALRLAIAGNTIDFVIDPDADRSNILQAVHESLSAPIAASLKLGPIKIYLNPLPWSTVIWLDTIAVQIPGLL
jgi:uncharacterized protein with ATP-grasp and redox domains